MAYDQKTYGASPFARGAQHLPKPVPKRAGAAGEAVAPDPEALSDQLGESPLDDDQQAESADGPPDLPGEYAPTLKPRKSSLSVFHIPRGRVTGLNLLGEALGWLMGWGTVGFFRAYLPAPVVSIFDHVFTPWGMASGTLISALMIGQLLNHYRLKMGSLRLMATTAIEYGETHHRADTQINIDKLLTQAEEKTEQVSRWLVSWLTALGCLFIIGAFY